MYVRVWALICVRVCARYVRVEFYPPSLLQGEAETPLIPVLVDKRLLSPGLFGGLSLLSCPAGS